MSIFILIKLMTIFFAFNILTVSSSAIPMWEFLNRSEKINYLYNILTKQVTEYCEGSTVPDCNKALLLYGLTNLAKANDETLEAMDPYQRGAADIIWQSIMKDNSKPSSVFKDRHDYYSDPFDSNSDENHLEASSNNVQVSSSIEGNAIGGPMVVRVRPDGSPVVEDAHRSLPKDEDIEEMRIMSGKPTMSVTVESILKSKS